MNIVPSSIFVNLEKFPRVTDVSTQKANEFAQQKGLPEVQNRKAVKDSLKAVREKCNAIRYLQ